jgi:hypothetical protein
MGVVSALCSVVWDFNEQYFLGVPKSLLERLHQS